jgi:hypothetical protein
LRNSPIRRRPSTLRARSFRFRLRVNRGLRLATFVAPAPILELVSNFQQASKMATREDLNMLSRLVDDALQLAIKLDETMAAYILSIASREVSERIEQAEAERPPEPD